MGELVAAQPLVTVEIRLVQHLTTTTTTKITTTTTKITTSTTTTTRTKITITTTTTPNNNNYNNNNKRIITTIANLRIEEQHKFFCLIEIMVLNIRAGHMRQILRQSDRFRAKILSSATLLLNNVSKLNFDVKRQTFVLF